MDCCHVNKLISRSLDIIQTIINWVIITLSDKCYMTKNVIRAKVQCFSMPSFFKTIKQQQLLQNAELPVW